MTLSETYRARLAENARSAWEDLRKFADLGDFLLSDEANRVLNNFHKEIDEASDDPSVFGLDYYETVEIAVDQALPKIKRIASKDLYLR